MKAYNVGVMKACMLLLSLPLMLVAADKESKVKSAEQSNEERVRTEFLHSFFNPSTRLYKDISMIAANAGDLSAKDGIGGGYCNKDDFYHQYGAHADKKEVTIRWTIYGRENKPTHSAALNELIAQAIKNKGLKEECYPEFHPEIDKQAGGIHLVSGIGVSWSMRCSDTSSNPVVEHCIYDLDKKKCWSKFTLTMDRRNFEAQRDDYLKPLLIRATLGEQEKILHRIKVLS
jgi:hypothetical protein